ncbi:MAG: membrane protein insertion efficiency factor YidD [Myxococcota bacterium]
MPGGRAGRVLYRRGLLERPHARAVLRVFAVASLCLTTACSSQSVVPDRAPTPEYAPGMRTVLGLPGVEVDADGDAWAPNPLHPVLSLSASDVDDGESHEREHEHNEDPSAPRASSWSSEAASTVAGSPVAAGAWILFQVYKETYSRFDGNRCGFYPSCSRFGLDAVRARGARGVVLTSARLMRNHGPRERAFYRVSSRGSLRDPIENYTFFLGPPRLDAFHEHDDPAHAWFVHVRAARLLSRAQERP